MSNITFSTSALTHASTSACAATPMSVRDYWGSQLPTAINGPVVAAANNRKDGRGARAFEDPL
jgi:hypothetical protein